MFYKIIASFALIYMMISMIYADESSATVKSNCTKVILRKKMNQHRLTQSTLIVPQKVLMEDRHRFILERLENAKPSSTTTVIAQASNVRAVPVDALKPVLSDEPKKINGLYSDEGDVTPKLKFDWTMMPPVRASIAYKFGEGEKKLSQGIVYEVKSNQIVHAPIDGLIIFSGIMKEFEHVVMIEKDFQNIILVAGISNADVKQGDKVYRGQKIGSVIKGRWVYVEFRNSGTSIDPQQVLMSGKINEE